MNYSTVLNSIESHHISQAVAEIDNGMVSHSDRIMYLENAHNLFISESAIHFLKSGISNDAKKHVMGLIISRAEHFDASISNKSISFTTGETPEEMVMHTLDVDNWELIEQD
ncbi:MAG: hypothetical protein HOE44_07065 [Candidatus Marinimicrobia bacterium]|nr:hypothetical protein [Candidatus Neomarinimicrobiota bacterium]MBT4991820.1 hypothetical protein [Candidatus Neomarinimicrobiota bacterium]MBT5268152.1 hypothetical protein [Candidatus Neomarinimicrobiota bacterium]